MAMRALRNNMTLENIAIDTVRLTNFLEHNQLVQANAIVCRLENAFKDKIKDEFGRPADWAHDPDTPDTKGTPDTQDPNKPEDAKDQEPKDTKKDTTDTADTTKKPKDTQEQKTRLEDHPCWKAFRATIKIKQFVLSGNRETALKETHALAKLPLWN